MKVWEAGGGATILAREQTLIATLGNEAQVVTLALDALLRRGEAIQRVLIIHTAPEAEAIAGALPRLITELRSPYYSPTLELETILLIGPSGPLADVDTAASEGAKGGERNRGVREKHRKMRKEQPFFGCIKVASQPAKRIDPPAFGELSDSVVPGGAKQHPTVRRQTDAHAARLGAHGALRIRDEQRR